MKSAKILTVASTLLAMTSGAVAVAATDWPSKAYDLTYALTSPSGSSQMRMVSNGKGKIATQTTVANMKMTSIADYPAKMAYSIMDAQKMVYKMKLQPSQGNILSDESAAKLKAKSLGNKVIDGHPCKGWQYSASGVDTETWIATDLEAAVKSVTKSPQGTTTMVLKSVSTKSPDESIFVIPAGYKVMQPQQ